MLSSLACALSVRRLAIIEKLNGCPYFVRASATSVINLWLMSKTAKVPLFPAGFFNGSFLKHQKFFNKIIDIAIKNGFDVGAFEFCPRIFDQSVRM